MPMRNQIQKPPRFAEWILGILANYGQTGAILGDFREEFLEVAEEKGSKKAWLWYWRLILLSLPSFLKNHIYWSGQMFKNYLKIFLRNVSKHRAYSAINISGLAIAMAASFMIFLYISFELSYDRFHKYAGRLYRVRNDRIYSDIHDKSAGCPPAVGPTLKEEFPEIMDSARLMIGNDLNNIVSFVPDKDYIQTVPFRLRGYDQAEKVSVVGTFNGWNQDRDVLKKKGNLWECEILLPPGRYSYRFVVDSREMCDPDNPNQTIQESEPYSSLTIKEPASVSRMETYIETRVFYTDSSFLIMFTFPLLQGAPETALENPKTAVISETTARKYFGKEDPMGKMIILTNSFGKQLYQITGIAKDVPENSHLKFDFLLSYKTLIQLRPEAADYWGWNYFYTYVLLSPEADPQSLQLKFEEYIEKHELNGEDYKRQFILQPLKDIHLHSNLRYETEPIGSSRTVYFLTFIALFILLVAWINYVNLSTAQSITRAKEVGIRKILGSQRTQLVKQFLSESGLLNITALASALVLVKIFLPFFNRLTGKSLTLSPLFESNAWVWLVVSILLGTAFSAIYPSLVLSAFAAESVLKGNFIRSSRGINFRKIMVVFQFAISIILIVGTMTVYRQLRYMQNKDLGVRIDQTMAVRIPGNYGYSSDRVKRFKQEVEAFPAIKAVTSSSSIPGKEYSNAASGIRPLRSGPEDGKRCFFVSVDYDTFDFYGNNLVAGRMFSKEFSTDLKAVILNEEAVQIFGYKTPEQALNQKIYLGGLGQETREVIGVVKNYHHKSLRDSFQPILFTLTEGDNNSKNNYLSLKIDGLNTDQTIGQVKNKWDEIYARAPFEYFFLDETFNNLYQADRQFGHVFGLFALLSIFISCLGLFGLAAFFAEQRTKEIGIRRVLGATSSGIIYLLSKEFGKWILISNLIAWPLSYFAMNKWLRNFAFRINPGIWTFFSAAFLALIIALVTVSYQSVKTALASPADALRYE
jgi:putative ABC transport system permease protein